jgi:hypothetical protein
MNLARIRALVIWLTASLALTAVVYAPKKRVAWSNDTNSWQRTNLSIHDKERDFIWLVSRNCNCDQSSSDWQVRPDWSRIAGELLLIGAIGGGLIFTLREQR